MTKYKVNTSPSGGFCLAFLAALSNAAYQIEVKTQNDTVVAVSFFSTEDTYNKIMKEFQPGLREREQRKIAEGIIYSMKGARR